MPEIRRCAQCNQSSLMPVSRKMQVYNSIIHYKCNNCDAELDITPLASIGVVTMVGILALGFWGLILSRGSGAPGTLVLGLYGAAVVALLLVTGLPIIKHLQNPVMKNGMQSQMSVTSTDAHIFKEPIIWIEKFGYVAGLFAPLVIVLCVLGGAALIGYVRFTYFQM